jgi:hypothetical protein
MDFIRTFWKTALVAFIVGLGVYFLLIKPAKAEAVTVETVVVDPYIFEPFQRESDGAWGHRMTPGPIVFVPDGTTCEAAKADVVSQIQGDEAATALAIDWPGTYTPLSNARCITFSKSYELVPTISTLEPILCEIKLTWSQGFDYIGSVNACLDGQ